MRKRRTAYCQDTALSFEGLLDQIHGECQCTDQWARDGVYAHALEHEVRADALMDVIEVHLTGSSGASHGGWGLKHTDGKAPRINDYGIGKHDIKLRLNVLIKELKHRNYIAKDFHPNASTTPA